MDRKTHDEIRFQVDAGNFLTAKWVGNKLSIHISESRALLAEFLLTNKDVYASYCISGTKAAKCGTFFEIVTDDKLEETKSTFSSVSSVTVYSIQKLKSDSIASQIYASDVSQAKEFLMMQPNVDHFLLNGVGGISLADVTCGPVGKRLVASQRAIATTPKDQGKESAADQIARVFSTSSKPSQPTTAASVPTAYAAVKNFFGASSSTVVKTINSDKPKKEDRAEAKKSADAKTANVVKTDNIHDVSKGPAVDDVGTISKEDDDEEWDDGSGHKPDQNILKQRIAHDEKKHRKRYVVKDDDEEGIDSVEKDESVQIEATSSQEEPPGDAQGHPGKGKRFVHGAMDDYLEDVAIAAEIAKKEEPDGSGIQPIVSTGKRKKRKLVEKMYADEKGYLVTENVWEEVTDDESENQSVRASNGSSEGGSSKSKPSGSGDDSTDLKKKSVAQPAAKKSASQPKKAAASSGAPQKSMMSFFSKK